MNLGDLAGGVLTVSMVVAMAGIALSLEPRIRSRSVMVMPVVLAIASFGVGVFFLFRYDYGPISMVAGVVNVRLSVAVPTAIVFGAVAGLGAFAFEGWLTRFWYSRHHSIELSFLYVTVAGRSESMGGVARLAQVGWLFAVLSIISASGEEFFYRGVMAVVGGQQSGIILWQVVLLQALLYGINHIPFGIPSVVGKTIFGVVLGVVAVIGGVLCSLLVHLAYQVIVSRQFRNSRKEVAA